MTNDYSRIKDLLRRAYDRDVDRRHAMVLDQWRTNLVDQFAAELRQRGLRRVVELGAGTGQLAERLRGHGLDVLATDLSVGNVDAMRRRGLDAAVVDFSDLPFDDAAFDAVFTMNALLHVPKDRLHEVLAGIRRILRPGGLLQIVVWGGRQFDGGLDHEWLDPPRYFSFYDDAAFHALAFDGFEPLHSRTLDVDDGAPDLHPQVKLLEAV